MGGMRARGRAREGMGRGRACEGIGGHVRVWRGMGRHEKAWEGMGGRGRVWDGREGAGAWPGRKPLSVRLQMQQHAEHCTSCPQSPSWRPLSRWVRGRVAQQ